jgi:hypothetical protein
LQVDFQALELKMPLLAVYFFMVTFAREASLSKACLAEMASGAPVEE